MKTVRQDFEIGDLVEFEINGCTNSIGVVIDSKIINANMKTPELYKWHRDEYHCKVKLSDGESRWVRAKWLKIVSKA